jgi:hypothetical protein
LENHDAAPFSVAARLFVEMKQLMVVFVSLIRGKYNLMTLS